MKLTALLCPLLSVLAVLLCCGQPALAWRLVSYDTQLLPSYSSIIDAWYNFIDGEPFSRDYWHEVRLHVKNATMVATKELQNVQARFPEARASMEAFVDAVNATLADAAKLRPPNVDLNAVEEEISWALNEVLEKAKTEFPPPRVAPSHEERLYKANTIVSRANTAIINVLVKHGVDEAEAQRILDHMGATLVTMIVLTGDLREQHPALFDAVFETLIFGAFVAIIPEGWLLGRLLGMLGFGPAGPVKGSSAALMQRRFFGATVGEGSWFARLQAAGMKKSVASGCLA
ncbi:hypothetical protein BD626DRAFT_474315 [Schizophyllum amplum]|uniref:Uncharacterized protein n=1 Tax=Schizophyllum amplum TaxID=97359 RepID=A0A550CXL4_9AGAR|nr:hypothetical protein BD626DRAFT_474315 [Auriculariopsis ampla]